jgi:hypothetical protein
MRPITTDRTLPSVRSTLCYACQARNSGTGAFGRAQGLASGRPGQAAHACEHWPNASNHHEASGHSLIHYSSTRISWWEMRIAAKLLLSRWHTCRPILLALFLNKNFLVRNGNFLLRVSTTKFTNLCAISSLFSPTLQMCQYHQVYIIMCKCVSIFTNIFQMISHSIHHATWS